MPYKDPVVAKEKQAEYQRLHRDLIRERRRAYYVQHKEEMKAAHREYQRRPWGSGTLNDSTRSACSMLMIT